MYDRFQWTNAAARRNRLTAEYEPAQPFFLLALAERAGCRTFIDIGANIGAYSLFATLVPSIVRVMAFEANPETLPELEANVRLNELSEVIEVHGKAVSDAAGSVEFGVVSRLSGANSVVSSSIHEAAAFHDRIAVEAVTLDEALGSSRTAPLCLKIDVEGHEPQVLDGAAKTLSSAKAVIQIETYEQCGRRAADKLADLGYVRLTAIGPDAYFTNIPELASPAVVLELLEEAMAAMIDFNHRNKVVMVKRGDVAVQLTGKTGDLARAVAKRLIGKHL